MIVPCENLSQKRNKNQNKMKITKSESCRTVERPIARSWPAIYAFDHMYRNEAVEPRSRGFLPAL